MKILFLTIITFLLTCSLSAISTQNVYAVGNTNSDTNPGQVRTSLDGSVLYLTTTINQNARSASQSQQPSTRPQTTNTGNSPSPATSISAIVQPVGFVGDLGSYVNFLLNLVMAVSLLLAFLYFILAGLQWITSGGDKSKTEEARNKIVNAFVGILIVASSFALASYVAWILGFESINDAITGIRRINPS